MNVGDWVQHNGFVWEQHGSQQSLDVGRVVRVHGEGSCDVAFGSVVHPRMSSSSLSLVSPEVAMQAQRRKWKSEVLAALFDGSTDLADFIYNDKCSYWWEYADYSQHRDDASKVHAIVCSYATDTLQKIGERLEGEIFQLSPQEAAGLKPSFAGAQLTFFENFSDYFAGAGRAGISTNYRSAAMIVGAGNRIMADRGMPASANKSRLDGTKIEARAIDECFVEFRPLAQHDVVRQSDAMYFVGTPFAPGKPQSKRPSVSELQAAKAMKTCVEFVVESAWRDADGTFVAGSNPCSRAHRLCVRNGTCRV